MEAPHFLTFLDSRTVADGSRVTMLREVSMQCGHIRHYGVHMNVGVRDLKQHLSEYLRQVADGHTLTVTDRGVPVATISPISPGNPLTRAIDEGWVRAPLTERGLGEVRRARSSRRVVDVLREDRGE